MATTRIAVVSWVSLRPQVVCAGRCCAVAVYAEELAADP